MYSTNAKNVFPTSNFMDMAIMADGTFFKVWAQVHLKKTIEKF